MACHIVGSFKVGVALTCSSIEVSIPDDALSALVELDASLKDAIISIWSVCGTVSNTLAALVVTDIAIEVCSVTMTV